MGLVFLMNIFPHVESKYEGSSIDMFKCKAKLENKLKVSLYYL